jgi:hypothetical protein
LKLFKIMEQIKMNNWEGLKVDKTKIVTPILQNIFLHNLHQIWNQSDKN